MQNHFVAYLNIFFEIASLELKVDTYRKMGFAISTLHQSSGKICLNELFPWLQPIIIVQSQLGALIVKLEGGEPCEKTLHSLQTKPEKWLQQMQPFEGDRVITWTILSRQDFK